MEKRNEAQDSKEYWSEYEVNAIPTKESLHCSFSSQLSNLLSTKEHPTLLDLGCGDGRLSKQLVDQGFKVIGVDINKEAAAVANKRFTGSDSRAFCEDCTKLRLSEKFDCCLCQLLLSIIGNVKRRRQLLRTASNHLVPGGVVLISASGASEEINKNYAQLYRKDGKSTGENRTYYSRDATGKVLYMTHHFDQEELQALLEECDLNVKEIHVEKESSSRRPNEAAYFYYIVATKKTQQHIEEVKVCNNKKAKI